MSLISLYAATFTYDEKPSFVFYAPAIVSYDYRAGFISVDTKVSVLSAAVVPGAGTRPRAKKICARALIWTASE